MSRRSRRLRKPRRLSRAPRESEVQPPGEPDFPLPGTRASRRRDAYLHALLQNGWIVVGVFALGWSASVTAGGIYLETLFCSLALHQAVWRAGRAQLAAGDSITRDELTRAGTLGDRMKTTLIAGSAQGVFLLAFGAGVLLGPENVDPIWRMSLRDLGPAALGAMVTGLIEYGRLRRRIPEASESWLQSRADLQFSTTLALVLFMVVLPWTFFLVGERGLFVVLIGGKAALDIWLADRRPSRGAAG